LPKANPKLIQQRFDSLISSKWILVRVFVSLIFWLKALTMIAFCLAFYETDLKSVISFSGGLSTSGGLEAAVPCWLEFPLNMSVALSGLMPES
jgi:hypothetical protein